MSNSALPSAAVVTVSDRAAAGDYADACGPCAVERLRAAGYVVASARVVPDGAASVRSALQEALATGARFVVTTGGTGVGPRDRTPEGTRPLLELELPGIMHALWSAGAEHTPMAVLSRGLAGITAAPHAALIVNLPGSLAGVEQGLDVLVPLAEHVLDQLAGGDHG